AFGLLHSVARAGLLKASGRGTSTHLRCLFALASGADRTRDGWLSFLFAPSGGARPITLAPEDGA
ncbi:hypothetical protein, partial [Haematospirillum jordaniae]|uniref:hypothetical protein n=1 Tax=Haematospirillum jordaniae TaxID=1549855 RepID=UPI001ADEBD76